ncbi:MAG: MBOAT family protein, partial [Planctomycetes bacterium]|nr:MBOAT family protein [Planctomycetota bacterium]
MLFNSSAFLVFFGLFISLWPLLRARNNLRWTYLTIASLVFYGWWDWRFLFLIAGSGLIDYLAALGMVRFPRWRKCLLVLSILGNVGTLAMFKYLDFCLANVNRVLSLLGLEAAMPLAGLPLPIGISFYTFQSMSYTIDTYRGKLEPTRNILHFFAYLSMFPQLVAGPIVRASHLLPQLKSARPTTGEERWDGLKLVLFGYAKKVIIADNLAPVVQTAFAAATPERSCLLWWLVMVMFAVQIY